MSLLRSLLAPSLMLTLGLGCATTSAVAPRSPDDLSAPKLGWREANDDASIGMRAIAKSLGPLGVGMEHEAFSGFLSTGARATHALKLRARMCSTLVAVASRAVHDMDAALYSPEGELLASDSQPDAHPVIQVCAGSEPVTLYYALQVYDGAGSYLVVPFSSAAATLDRVAATLGAKPGVARLDAPSAEGPSRIAAFRDGLERRGFSPLQDEVRFPLVGAQHLRVAVPVESGHCYTAAAFAYEGVDGVNLRVLDDEGAEVARDESGEPDASTQFCVERDAEYAAELYGATKPGTALFMVLHATAEAIGGVSGLWLGERPLTPASTTPLSEALAEVTRRAARDGFVPLATALEGRLSPGEAISREVGVRARRCARIQAVGGPGVRRLSLTAKDATGQTLAAAEGRADSTFVHVCGTTAREVELQLRATEGAGTFALAVYDASLSAVAPSGADDRTSAALQQALRSARDAGFTPHGDFRSGPHLIHLQSDGPLSVPIDGASHCVRAYVLSTDPSVRAGIIAHGKLVDEPKSQGEPTRFCSKGAGDEGRDIAVRISTSAPKADAWLLVVVR